MTVYAITDTKKGEQGLRLLIFKLGPEQLLVTPVDGVKSALTPALWPCTFCGDPIKIYLQLVKSLTAFIST